MKNHVPLLRLPTALGGLIFVLLVAGAAVAAQHSYRAFEATVWQQVVVRLEALADLKQDALQTWRSERLETEAEILRQNREFSAHVREFLADPQDEEALADLDASLGSYHAYREYQEVSLLSTDGRVLLGDGAIGSPAAPPVADVLGAVLQSRQVAMVDLYRDDAVGRARLTILVPVLDWDAERAIAVVALYIDPQVRLYPILERRPSASSSAETLLLRRDGDALRILNPLPDGQAAALDLPAEDAQRAVAGQPLPALRAPDYRGVPSVMVVRAMPGTPWLLATKIDQADVNRVLQQRLWETALFFTVLAAAVGAGVVLLWRRNRVRALRRQLSATAALQESEARYRTLVEALDVSVSRWKPDTTLTYTNERYRSTFADTGGISGRWLDTLPEQRRTEVAELHRSLLANPRTITYEHGVAWPDGTARYFQWIDTPILDANGAVVEFQSVAIDITERKEAEQLIAAQRDLARIGSTAQASGSAWQMCVAIAVRATNMDSGGLYAFDAEQQTLTLMAHQGFSTDFARSVACYGPETPNVAKAVAGTPVYLSEAAMATRPLLAREGIRSMAVIPIHVHGRAIGALHVASKTRGDVPQAARHALETISAEIGNIIAFLRSEASLRESEVRFRKLIEHAPGAITLVGADGKLAFISSSTERVMGYRSDGMLGGEPAALTHPDDLPMLLGILGELMQTPGMVRTAHYRFRHQDGSWRWVESTISNLLHEPSVRALAFNFQDITERMQADLALRASEEQYRGLMESLDSAVFTVDERGTLLFLNDVAARTLGAGAQDLVGRELRALLPPAIAEAHLANVQSVIRTDTAHTSEVRFPVGGQVRWYRVSIQPIHDETGRVSCALVNATDIHELKTTQQELLELNQTLEERVRQRTAEVQDLYDHAPTGYHSLDPEGRIVLINQTELDWLGYCREELVGRSLVDIITPASRQVFERTFPAFKAAGYVRDVELEFIRKDGSTFPILLNATAIYDESGTYAMSRSTAFDITGRKAAETALRESEAQNRLLFEASPEAIVLFDAGCAMVRVNRAFELMTGMAAAQLEGRRLDGLALLRAADAEVLDGALAQTDSTGGFASAEVVLTGADGARRDIEVRALGLLMAAEQHYLAALRDITVEKQAAATLRRANAELARAARTKDEFLANMSHELRTPLNAVLGFSESLLEEVYGPLKARQEDALRHIATSGRHLLALINDILDLSKVEAGRLELRPTPFLVAEVCQASLLFFREPALKKEIALNLRLSNQSLIMRADAMRVKQMLVNLLSNAVKFTGQGGVVTLDVGVDAAAGVVRLAVQDTGIGIAPEDMPRLFQPFSQLDASLSRPYEGTGLGLVLVRRLAELHGGTCTVESELGKGSTFTITLPYHPPQPETAALPEELPDAPPQLVVPAHPAPGAAGGQVLVVDDNQDSLQVVGEFLQAKGYDVILASNGQEALEQARAARPSLILIDIQMPQLDGLEAIRRLRADPVTAATPIVALTALAMPGDKDRCLAAGANAYLTKPVDLHMLLELIGHAGTR